MKIVGDAGAGDVSFGAVANGVEWVTMREPGAAKPRRVAIIGAGVSGLGVAWALHRHPDRFDFRLFEAQSRVGGNAITADMPQDDGTLDSVRHIRHGVHSLRLPPHPPAHAAIRHRARRYPVQLQREVPRRRLCARFRLRHPAAVATRNREIPEAAETPALVRPAQPLAVQTAERSQPVQLHQDGNGSQPGRLLRRLPLQGPEAHVRQLPDGDERVRHARVPVLPVPGVLRYRDRDADADLGPGHPAHL